MSRPPETPLGALIHHSRLYVVLGVRPVTRIGTVMYRFKAPPRLSLPTKTPWLNCPSTLSATQKAFCSEYVHLICPESTHNRDVEPGPVAFVVTVTPMLGTGFQASAGVPQFVATAGA